MLQRPLRDNVVASLPALRSGAEAFEAKESL
jgi:hypothetical protein